MLQRLLIVVYSTLLFYLLVLVIKASNDLFNGLVFLASKACLFRRKKKTLNTFMYCFRKNKL